MANPWWILGGLYALGRLNQSSYEARKNAQRLAELEKIVHGEQPEPPPVTTNSGTDPGGCLGCCGCLVTLVGMAVVVLVLGWMVMG